MPCYRNGILCFIRKMQLMRVKKALTLLTVSDSLVTNEETTAEEKRKKHLRQYGSCFGDCIGVN